MRLHSLCVLFFLAAWTDAARPDDALPRVPEGFTIEKAAGPPLVKHPVMAGFDDRGRLFVAETAGQNLPAAELLEQRPNLIRLLVDTTGDGRFDKSTVFADDMTFPQGALWYRGALYVASPPSIWRLEDTTGDGVADRRDQIVTGFGFNGNAADIHGCFLGPEGRLYWCDGRHGHEFFDEQGNLTSKGKAARIFSCRPDGSDVRVYCGGGMDNPVEIDFTEEGEMLGTVNILHNPRGDCLVHWVEGGVYPRHDQEDCLAEFRRTGDLLPPVKDLGHIAVSGLTRYRSTHFGPDYTGNLFIAVFNTHKVLRSVLTRSGATFESREEEFLVSDDPDFHPTDVLEDADGSLLVIDTGGWFRIGCPTSQVAKPEVHGGIYRIRRDDGLRVEDPRGLDLNLDQMRPDELAGLLDDPRPDVRERAIDLLARQPSTRELSAVLDRSGDERSAMARRNALWALARMGQDYASAAEDHGKDEPVVRNLDALSTALAVNGIRRALDDEDDSVRLTAVRALKHLLPRHADHETIHRLTAMLASGTPAVRREAATVLGVAGESPTAFDDETRRTVVAALGEATRDAAADRVLEHALIYALIQIADREATLPHLRDSSPQVRRAALVALDQMEGGGLTRDLVTPLLDTDDPVLQKQALEIISRRDGWASEILALLTAWLAEPALSDDRASILRGVLLAQSGDGEIQRLVAEALDRPDVAAAVRLLLLEVVHRAPLEALPPSWTAALGRTFDADDPAARLQAVRTIQSRELAGFDERLTRVARDETEPPALRVEALAALGPRQPSLDAPLFAFLLDRLDEDHPPLDRQAAARALAESRLSERQLIDLTDHFDRAGPLAVPALLRAFARSTSEAAGLKLVATLEHSAVTGLPAEELAGLLRAYPPSVQSAAAGLLQRLGVDLAAQQARMDELAPLLSGGDRQRGREVFFGRKAACASCHAVAGEGGRVGPDLTKIGAIRTGRDLLEAVVFPSASFAREYRTYVVLTDAGRIHTGIIGRQTPDSLSLRTAELAEIRIPRDSIEELRESPVSIMPAGMDRTLNEDELRDLLAYLQQLK